MNKELLEKSIEELQESIDRQIGRGELQEISVDILTKLQKMEQEINRDEFEMQMREREMNLEEVKAKTEAELHEREIHENANAEKIRFGSETLRTISEIAKTSLTIGGALILGFEIIKSEDFEPVTSKALQILSFMRPKI